MLKQALHPSKSRPQIHELGIKFVHVSHRRRLPSVTGRGIISQFADLLLLSRRHRLLGARHVARQRVANCGARLFARKLSSHPNLSRLLEGR
jgi:hypothetical protein